MRRHHVFPWGSEVQPDGVRFRLWAPAHEKISLQLDAQDNSPGVSLPMQQVEDGWHELVTSAARAGSRYRFVLPDGLSVPDPASRFQPQDVHGSSEVIDPASFKWRNSDWHGRDWHTSVIYELHVGTFTAEGTFNAAAARLGHLASLGVTAVQIMPVADFPGVRGWGYDGVLLFAPDSSYGRPEDFKNLIDTAHSLDLMVFLDVVYNHFGPDGNYLPTYAPQFFNARHQTPWGAAVNYDGEFNQMVREFVLHNALYWLQEFYLDGLRLDAVHSIMDDSDQHLLRELVTRVRDVITDRKVHLIIENEANQSSLLAGADSQIAYTAQWNDDVHHVLHVAATGEQTGYYREYCNDTHKLAKALAEGFAFQGEYMEFCGAARGEPSCTLPPTAFVSFIQNHDQIGNRAFGERIASLAGAPQVRAIAATYLLLPQIPMIFMGEEWGTRSPFLFFCDFHDELGEAVRAGRTKEFARMHATDGRPLPDPLAVTTFEATQLQWQELGDPDHADTLAWYRRILGVRARSIIPLLPAMKTAGTYELLGEHAARIHWQAGDRQLILLINLSDTPLRHSLPAGDVIWRQGDYADRTLGPWGVLYMVAPL